MLLTHSKMLSGMSPVIILMMMLVAATGAQGVVDDTNTDPTGDTPYVPRSNDTTDTNDTTPQQDGSQTNSTADNSTLSNETTTTTTLIADDNTTTTIVTDINANDTGTIAVSAHNSTTVMADTVASNETASELSVNATTPIWLIDPALSDNTTQPATTLSYWSNDNDNSTSSNETLIENPDSVNGSFSQESTTSNWMLTNNSSLNETLHEEQTTSNVIVDSMNGTNTTANTPDSINGTTIPPDVTAANETVPVNETTTQQAASNNFTVIDPLATLNYNNSWNMSSNNDSLTSTTTMSNVTTASATSGGVLVEVSDAMLVALVVASVSGLSGLGIVAGVYCIKCWQESRRPAAGYKILDDNDFS